MQELINNIFEKYKNNSQGKLADYIPELAKVDPSLFSIAITTVEGDTTFIGDHECEFTLQSASKPFVYGLATLENGKEFIHSKVGVEPSGEAFNSIVELEKHTNRPYNPMINSGAIAISSFIKGNDPSERLKKIVGLFESMTQRRLHVDTSVFLSEKKTAHRNRSIAHLLRHFGVIDSDIDESLDLYFQQCSVLVNVKDLSLMAATLANSGIQPRTHKEIYPSSVNRDILSLMFTCGMYDTAGWWAFNIGLPAKSGVSGALIAVVPGVMGIAIYSPLIDKQGHSIRGVHAIQDIASQLNLNIFNN